jgi:hypothetical protein
MDIFPRLNTRQLWTCAHRSCLTRSSNPPCQYRGCEPRIESEARWIIRRNELRAFVVLGQIFYDPVVKDADLPSWKLSYDS